jgi:hypothetical protein
MTLLIQLTKFANGTKLLQRHWLDQDVPDVWEAVNWAKGTGIKTIDHTKAHTPNIVELYGSRPDPNNGDLIKFEFYFVTDAVQKEVL